MLVIVAGISSLYICKLKIYRPIKSQDCLIGDKLYYCTALICPYAALGSVQ